MAKAKSSSPEPSIPANLPPLPDPHDPGPVPEPIITGLTLNERVNLLRAATKAYREALERVIPAGNDTLLAGALSHVEAAAHTANRAING